MLIKELITYIKQSFDRTTQQCRNCFWFRRLGVCGISKEIMHKDSWCALDPPEKYFINKISKSNLTKIINES